MKEYKLSAKSKYSVLYLLCGLFMFFFMFAIFNICSYADSITVDAGQTVNGFVEGNSYSYNVNDYDFPYCNLYSSGSVSHDSSSVCSLALHVVTSTGDFVLDSATYNKTNSGNSLSSSKYLSGVPLYTYGEYSITNDSSSSKNYTVTVNSSLSPSVSSAGSWSDLISKLNSLNTSVDNIESDVNNIESDVDHIYSQILDTNAYLHDIGLYNSYFARNSGYSNIAPLKLSAPFSTYHSWFDTSSGWFPLGSDFCFTFEKYNNGTSFAISGGTAIYAFRPQNGKLFFVFCAPYGASISDFHLFISDGVRGNYTLDSSIFSSLGSVSIGGTAYTYYSGSYDLGYYDDVSNIIIVPYGDCDVTMPFFSFGVFNYISSISDYMAYVNNEWDNVQPSVISTNQNTAQSVSDISTAQTFETSAFDNFDTQFSNSGLDTFSMSFASTPLLWVSSIITTFYNNMPSTFQYLLMFVAFVGILCTVLNVFGRVAQRFGGGDSATKLNSKDVFSKIEKNGSI